MHWLLIFHIILNKLNLFFIFIVLFHNVLSTKSKVPFFLKNQYCLTRECEDLASRIESSLNRSIKPCGNFYEFACGGWVSQTLKPDSEPVWNHWQELSYKINNRIEEILTSPQSSYDESLVVPKIYYKSCIHMKLMEKSYLNNLRSLINEFGGWPVHSTLWNYDEFNPFETIAKLTRFLGIHPIINIDVNIDYKNNKKYIIYIEPGNLIFPTYILLNPRQYKLEINAYKTWIYETVKHLYPGKVKPAVKFEINKIIGVEISLAKMITKTKNERMTLDSLSKKLHLNWKKLFDILYEGSNINVEADATVVVKNYSYLKNANNLLKKLDSKTIANYLMWYMVKDLSKETSQYMKNLNFGIDKIILKTKSDLTRRDECLTHVKEYFSYILIPKYKERFLNPNTFTEVKEIVNNIKIQFIKLLRTNNWMNDETKVLSIEKVKNIRYFVGYSSFVDNDSYVENYYGNLNITSHHFANTLRLKRFVSEKKLFQLNNKVDQIQWPSNAFDVNGFYSVLQNAIFIPLGLLDVPFFHAGRPNALNYGAIGSLIGHEVTHSLDNTGRHADKDGNIRKWWKKSDIKKYQEKSECYKNYYSQLDVDEHLTMEENVADNIGLKLSFLAFEPLKAKHQIPVSVQLAEFTKEQLYFISYAQMWCEIPTDSDLFSLDEHAPVHDRVLGTLHNSQFFHNAFNCKKMLNQTSCEIW